MQVERGIYMCRNGSEAEVHFQIWNGCWVGKENDDIRVWRQDGEEQSEDTALELVRKICDLESC